MLYLKWINFKNVRGIGSNRSNRIPNFLVHKTSKLKNLNISSEIQKEDTYKFSTVTKSENLKNVK